MIQLETRPEAPGEQAAVLDVVRRAFGAEDPAEGDGIAALVATTHAEAETLGAVSLVAVAADSVGLERPSDRVLRPACQVRPLTAYDDSLTDRVVHPDVFWRFDAVGLRGETLAMVEAALADREADDGHDGGTA